MADGYKTNFFVQKWMMKIEISFADTYSMKWSWSPTTSPSDLDPYFNDSCDVLLIIAVAS